MEYIEEFKRIKRINKILDCYRKQGFDEFQINEIENGLMDDLNVSIYAKLEYHYLQMSEIRYGLQDGLNVSIYAKPKFKDWQQMEQIRLGLKEGLDASLYANSKFSVDQMSAIRWGLEKKLNIVSNKTSKFYNRKLSEFKYFQNVNIPYSLIDFNYEQLDIIDKGLKDGLSKKQVALYATPQFDDSQMRIIYEGFKQGIDASIYAKPKLYPIQMEKIKNSLISPTVSNKESTLGSSARPSIQEKMKSLLAKKSPKKNHNKNINLIKR